MSSRLVLKLQLASQSRLRQFTSTYHVTSVTSHVKRFIRHACDVSWVQRSNSLLPMRQRHLAGPMSRSQRYEQQYHHTASTPIRHTHARACANVTNMTLRPHTGRTPTYLGTKNTPSCPPLLTHSQDAASSHACAPTAIHACAHPHHSPWRQNPYTTGTVMRGWVLLI